MILYLTMKRHPDHREGDSYMHMHAGLNTGKEIVQGLGVFMADNETPNVSEDRGILAYLQTSSV